MTLRARAREDASHFRTLLVHAAAYGGSIDEWQELVRIFRREGNKYAWRRLMARRTSAFAVTLRGIERVLGERYAGRVRALTGLAWDFIAFDDSGEPQLVARVSSQRPKTIDDLRAPVLVEILHLLVDVDALRRVLHRKRGPGAPESYRGTRPRGLSCALAPAPTVA